MTAPDPDTLRAPADTVAAELVREPHPLFAILDAARVPSAKHRARRAGARHQSLYEGGGDLADHGPYLVELTPETGLLDQLLTDGWGRSWGVYLTADLPFEELRRHLRRFLMVTLPDGREAYFRFYDPRVLRVFLTCATFAEARALLGPVTAYSMESADARSLLRFAAGPNRVLTFELALNA